MKPKTLDYKQVLLRRHEAFLESSPEEPEGPLSWLQLKNRRNREKWAPKYRQVMYTGESLK